MARVFIVTGATGFLGNNVIRLLSEDKENEIRALVYYNEPLISLADLPCKIFYGDVTKLDSLKEIFKVKKKDEVYVIHCAAIVYIKYRYNKKVHEVNVNGTKNVIKKVQKIGAKLIYVSSVHAIKEKKSKEEIKEVEYFDEKKVKGLYAKTKAEIANYILKLVKEEGLKAVIVHPSGMIGPNDFKITNMTHLIIEVVKRKLPAAVKGGYDFSDVRDVARGIINACTLGEVGKCYILANRYISVKELVDLVSDISKTKRIKLILPLWFTKIVAPIYEMYYSARKKEPLFTSYSLYTLGLNPRFSSSLAKEKLNYTNRDFRATIEDTLSWLKENQYI